MSTKQLTIVEECLLLGLDDETGRLHCGAHSQIAHGAALLGELLLEGRIQLVQEGKKTFVEPVAGAEAPEDPVLASAFTRILEAKRRAQTSSWVARFAGTQPLRALCEGLYRKGILKVQEEQFLLFFKRKIFPERDPGPEREIESRLDGVLRGTREPDDRTLLLLSIAWNGKLLGGLYSAKELKEWKPRVEALEEGQVMGKAAKSVITAQAAAVNAAVTAAIVTTVIN